MDTATATITMPTDSSGRFFQGWQEGSLSVQVDTAFSVCHFCCACFRDGCVCSDFRTIRLVGARSWHYDKRLNELEKQFAIPGGILAEHPLLRHWVRTMESKEVGTSTTATAGVLSETELTAYFKGAISVLPRPNEDEHWAGYFKGLAGIEKTGKNYDRYRESVRNITETGREGLRCLDQIESFGAPGAFGNWYVRVCTYGNGFDKI